MHGARRYLWYVPGIVLSLLVIVALMAFGIGRDVSASVTSVSVSPNAIAMGESATLTIRTFPGGRTIRASIDPNSDGAAVFSDTGATVAEAVSSSGYDGTATFTLLATAEGDVAIEVTDTTENEVQPVTLTVGAGDTTGSFITPPGTQPGVHLAVWGGGTIELLLATAPDAWSIWITRDGRFVGYIPGAPAFVNAPFLALFPGGLLPPGTVLAVVNN